MRNSSVRERASEPHSSFETQIHHIAGIEILIDQALRLIPFDLVRRRLNRAERLYVVGAGLDRGAPADLEDLLGLPSGIYTADILASILSHGFRGVLDSIKNRTP